MSKQRTMAEALGNGAVPPKAAPSPPAATEYLWRAISYVDGSLGNALDQAKAALAREARVDGKVVTEWVRSPSRHVRTTREPDGTLDTDGRPLLRERRHLVVYLVAICGAPGPERWVRLSTAIGPAAVEVATVEKGKVVKVEEYHPEDMRHVAMGYAQRALEGVE